MNDADRERELPLLALYATLIQPEARAAWFDRLGEWDRVFGQPEGRGRREQAGPGLPEPDPE